MKQLVFILLFTTITAVFFSSCEKKSEYDKTANGLQYKMIKDEKNPKAKTGEIIQYHIYWRTTKDSVFLDTREKNTPLYSKVDSPKFEGDPLEILSMMGPGD